MHPPRRTGGRIACARTQFGCFGWGVGLRGTGCARAPVPPPRDTGVGVACTGVQSGFGTLPNTFLCSRDFSRHIMGVETGAYWGIMVGWGVGCFFRTGQNAFPSNIMAT